MPPKRPADDVVSSSSDSDDESAPEATEDPAQFVIQSAGDAYLLASNRRDKTSGNLLSEHITDAFSHETLDAALAEYSARRSAAWTRLLGKLAAEGAVQASEIDAPFVPPEYDAYFEYWRRELDSGFNIVLYGAGSKRTVLDRFATYASEGLGHVCIVKGWDMGASIGGILDAIDSFLVGDSGSAVGRPAVDVADVDGSVDQGSVSEGEGASPVGDDATPADRVPPMHPNGREESSHPNGKGESPHSTQNRNATDSKTHGTAIASRLASLQHALDTASTHPIYLVLHSLDGPAFRSPAVLSQLALIAARPQIRLITSIDHFGTGLLLLPALASSRPALADQRRAQEHCGARPARARRFFDTQRAFGFVYHPVRTLSAYSAETAAAGTLPGIFPPSVFPAPDAFRERDAGSIRDSLRFVLAAVPARTRSLFALLATLQLGACAALPRDARPVLRPTGGPAGPAAPAVAVPLAILAERAVDDLVAGSTEQVGAQLGEFTDHGVVLVCEGAPTLLRGGEAGEGAEEGNADLPEGPWVWIPLQQDDLEEVVGELEE